MSTLELFPTSAAPARRADDAYYTDRHLALAIARQLAELIPAPSSIVEPSVGGGAFVHAARTTWPRANILAFDIRREAIEDLEAQKAFGANIYGVFDWLDPTINVSANGVDLILGNPPYVDGQAHIETSLGRLRPFGHLSFLMRLSLLGSIERARTLWSQPCLRYLQVVTPRPSCTGTGSDSTESAVFTWQRGYVGRAELLPPLLWRGGA